MSLIKKTGVVSGIVFIVFIVIQFIQPARNKSDLLLATDILKTVSIS